MDLKTDFESYWDAIDAGEEFEDRKDAARTAWHEHPEKHKAIMQWLRRHGPYTGRNPYFFILDFKMRKIPTPREAINYQGQLIPAGLEVFSAKYKGVWGMYTRDDITYFQMEEYSA